MSKQKLPKIEALSSNQTTRPLALVTGASRGIGYELAHELAKRGYDLVICADSPHIKVAAEHLSALDVGIEAVQIDLRDPRQVEKFWRAVESAARPVDVCCINAGVGVGGEFLETDLQAELDMVALNCASVVQLAKYVCAQMATRRKGHILITSSIAGTMPTPLETVYGATKAFDLWFSKSLRLEMEKYNVVVTALQPGATDTNFFHRAGMDNTKVGSEGKHANQPDEVARQGLDALFDNKEHVYAGNMKLKIQGELGGAAPDRMKAEMHRKEAKPLPPEKRKSA